MKFIVLIHSTWTTFLTGIVFEQIFLLRLKRIL